MNILLTVREELVCFVMLLFVLFYSNNYDMGKDTRALRRLCFYALGHVLFDLITVYSVNNLELFPLWANFIFHVIFYCFALLYMAELFCYTVNISYNGRHLDKIRAVSYGLIALFVIVTFFIPIDYIVGRGTNYSYGPVVFLGYGMAAMFMFSGLITVAVNRSMLSDGTKTALLPMMLSALVFIVAQALVPEFLFTGGILTLLTLGFFFSLANPVVALQQKVNTDALTGVYSRRCYIDDLPGMEKELSNGVGFTMLFCDLNDLKAVNDIYGHFEGDIYITEAATLIKDNLSSALKIYRMGGDEFLVIFRNISDETVHEELDKLHEKCEEKSVSLPYDISIAVGFASSDENTKSLSDVLRTADFYMYIDKMEIKRRRILKKSPSGNLDLSGLNDRLFDAFSNIDSHSVVFVTNIDTNITRLGDTARVILGLEELVSPNFIDRWIERVHPDDIMRLTNNISAVYSGRETLHHMFYRIKDKDGKYITCESRGSVIRGKGSDPDLFAGMMIFSPDSK